MTTKIELTDGEVRALHDLMEEDIIRPSLTRFRDEIQKALYANNARANPRSGPPVPQARKAPPGRFGT